MDKQSTILCVDDEKSILSSIKRVLMMEDYNVLIATSGAEGLEILEKNKVDLVISDQRMPEMTGHEFLKTVSEQYPECLRILLSGFSDFGSLVKTVNDGGIVRFISKPWDNEELVDIIRIALEQNVIIQHVYKILGGVSDIVKTNYGMTINIMRDSETVILKVDSENVIANEEEASEFLGFLFKTFSEGDVNVVSNSIVKDAKGVVFEIELDKGVRLRVEMLHSS